MMLERLGCGARQRALAEEIGIEGPSLVRLLDTLEAAGLVERAVDPADRRRHGLTVTEAGEGVLRSVKRRRTAWLAERLKRLSDEEIDAIEAAVEPLSKLLEEAP
jgi:DNA-binding MarR family transcriptional regulator